MASPTVKLYLVPGSSSLFPHILLRYCGILFTPQLVHFKTPPSILTTNDIQQVPVLLLDEKDIITENPAIAHAINQLAPSKKLFGDSPIDFVRVCEWLAWIAGPLHAQAWAPYMRPFRFTTDDAPHAQAAVRESARQKCLHRFATLESRLHPVGPWALGENFTAVDAYVFPFYQLARAYMEVDLTKYPRWTRILEGLLKLEPVKEVLKYEQEAEQEA